MRRAFGILTVASLALLMPVIAQIGGRPMGIIVARIFGPVNDPDFMQGGARLRAPAGGPVNAEMALRALNMAEAGRITHGAIFFRFRVVPPPPAMPNAMISIAADGADANVQNQEFIGITTLPGGGKGALLVFRARALRYDSNNPPNQVEQQGTVILMIQDRTPSASQRPNPTAPPDQVAVLPGIMLPAGLIYFEGQYVYVYNGVVVQGDIYTHGRGIPLSY